MISGHCNSFDIKYPLTLVYGNYAIKKFKIRNLIFISIYFHGTERNWILNLIWWENVN